jgi:hypothetical protein
MLIFLDTYASLVAFCAANVTCFVSHQWLARDEPDPDGVHYEVVCAGLRALCAKLGIDLSSLYVWIDCALAANRATRPFLTQHRLPRRPG